MVRILVGDLFASKAQTLVNTVNCVGVMGKGVALEFKKRFPKMYEDYVRRCKAGLVKLGKPYLYRNLTGPWILNFPTKDHWRSVSRLSDIVQGLEYLVKHYKEWGITSLAVPPLGCGQGQLEWRVVGPTLYRYLNAMDIPVELYAPYYYYVKLLPSHAICGIIN
ncbi:MAG: macro domain-containing protein, partial [Bacillota bacterium]